MLETRCKTSGEKSKKKKNVFLPFEKANRFSGYKNTKIFQAKISASVDRNYCFGDHFQIKPTFFFDDVC